MISHSSEATDTELEMPNGDATPPSLPGLLQPNPQLVQSLMEMGYGKSRAEVALIGCKNAGINEAVDWLVNNRYLEKSAAAEAREKDMNARPRSNVEYVGNVEMVITEEQLWPMQVNEFYNTIIDLLRDKDEQLVASASAILLCILRNPETSEELLLEGGICPQERRRRRRLTNLKEADRQRVQSASVPVKDHGAVPNMHPPKRTQSDRVVRDEKQGQQVSDVLHPFEGGFDYPIPIVESLLAALTKMTTMSIFTIRVLGELLHDLVVDRSMEMMFTPRHHKLFDQAFEQAKEQLRKQLPLPKYLHGHFLDTFEDEWNALSQQPTINRLISDPRRILPPSVFQKKKNAESNDSSAPPPPAPSKPAPKLNSSPQTDPSSYPNSATEDSGSVNQEPPSFQSSENNESASDQPECAVTSRKSVTLEPQHPQSAEQKKKDLHLQLMTVRKAIQIFLQVMCIRRDITGVSIAEPFLEKHQWQFKNNQSIQLNPKKLQITCQVILPNRQRKRVLLLTQSPDWLMLVSPPLNRMHQHSSIELTHPINKQEAFFKREDPRVIYLILTSTTCPGDMCAPVRDQPRNKWSLILYFDGGSTSASIDKAKNDAFKAMEFLEMNRKRTRDEVFHKVGAYFDWVPEPDPFLEEMAFKEQEESKKRVPATVAAEKPADPPRPPDSFDEPDPLLNAANTAVVEKSEEVDQVASAAESEEVLQTEETGEKVESSAKEETEMVLMQQPSSSAAAVENASAELDEGAEKEESVGGI